MHNACGENVSRETVPVSLGEIIQRVSDVFGVPVCILRGPQRARRYSHPRQAFCWVAQRTGRFSLPQIGAFLDNRDHTTIMYAVKAVEQRRLSNQSLALKLRQILDEIEIIPSHHPHTVNVSGQNCGQGVN